VGAAMTEHVVLPLKAYPGMPPKAPLAMPVQDFRRAPPAAPSPKVRRSTLVARLIAFGGTPAVAAFGVAEMAGVVSPGGVTAVEAVMTGLFALTFGWIAFAAMTALAGALVPALRHPTRPPAADGRLRTRTALVMPVFHEDPVRTAAALAAMARGVQATGHATAFEVVVLSDSQRAEQWIAETLACDQLRRELAGVMPVWYRRRWANTAKKAGNIKNFVENWGGRYDHFIVLDADSLMTPETLVALAAAMEADPRLGILQTVPALAGGETLYARLQQFAGRVHGPIVARGLAAWQGGDGNYWGHNAIIRTAAFAAACGLPTIPGRQPFGGPILSHDFVEAALIRRAGWSVEMAVGLDGSWEESPPSLIDAAIRDRRWAQGNLQHVKVIPARGLAWASRMHMAMGIMSYLASPLWLLLLACGFALSLHSEWIPPSYFAEEPQLFPTWPFFDAARMFELFGLTMALLLLPKLLGLGRALAISELRRGCGGAARLLASFVAEIAVATLLAPIMMIIHSRQVYEILSGQDAGWTAQRRSGVLSWREVWRRHRWHMAFGLAMGGAAWQLSPESLVWLAPTLAGLLFAVPLSRASGSSRIGLALRRAGLLLTPDETAPHPIFAVRAAAMRTLPQVPAEPLHALLTDPALRATHYRWASSAPRLRGAPDPAYLTAAEKATEARNLAEALAWLGPAERVHVAGHRAIAERIAALPDGDGPGAAPLRLAPRTALDLLPEPAHIRPPAA